MIAGLGAIFAAVFAIAPVREFFELELLDAGNWFLALLAVAIGLLVAAAAWRLPYVQALEQPDGEAPADDVPAPTHRPRTEDFAKVQGP
jgi:fructose-specific phosphotransferase system IIC component